MASTRPAGGSTKLDALAVLERDHRLVERLFEDFHKASPQQLDPIGRRICKMLRVHAQIEEELFYPAARAALQDAELIDRSEAEHDAAKIAIREVEARTSDAADYPQVMQTLQDLVERHVREEEELLFPKVRATQLNLALLAISLLERRDVLMDVLGLYSDDEQRATPISPLAGGESDRARLRESANNVKDLDV